MKIIADLHTHTLASTHAYSTLQEMAAHASEIGLYAIAMTDHAPAMPDSPYIWHFTSLRRLPQKISGVWVLKGIEANVCDEKGTLDIPQEMWENLALDWVIASLHSPVLAPTLTKRQVTNLWLAVAENPHVQMIGHCESPAYAFEMRPVIQAFAKNHKVVEMNAASALIRPGGEENMREILLLCAEYGTKIAINSDAHFSHSLAQVDSIYQLIEEIDFPKKQIVNASKENLLEFLEIYQSPILKGMKKE